ncbi:hypothetical protein [Pedobacter sp. Leaf176]|uniref:hypothetical protein n=1 Tax=Pedobacter sp. Leaf176 TaxID=1736286 RepID=UPI0006F671B2|nr:hypothetical protein [Pedobacter sp. Leaf176]KQR71777.1 hypothetical protein ASF92_00185 [Pedobacter sp. Leaf176]
MKKLFLILVLFTAFGCKKKSINPEDITQYEWLLSTATISPAMVINGKPETNFKTMSGPSGCLNSNYTLSFSKDGSYAFSSNGPLCDMISFRNAKYTRNGNEITLNDGGAQPSKYILSGNSITNKYTFEQNNVSYTVTYIYNPKQ